MSDELVDRLARAFRGGDMESFRFLVESLSRTLIAMAYRYTRNWETARDLTQDTWIRVYERIDRYDPGRPFANWLLTVHRNGCLNHLREGKARLEMTVAEMPEAAEAERPRGANPYSRLEQMEFMQRLRRAMEKLSEREQTIFSLVDIEHNGQNQAAEMLRIKPATLRATLHKARRKLARILRTSEDIS
ncbi:MAG TPA: sigma-70 family RNA polymerase sigma factor [Candidatus Eisenbacteria bacterium]|uniref:Sigma-70 family RNA polymerase sigma factor n=1 Tax=Eiseniibacteriota bacterium TaxID=2212470 RepID=A0A7V2F3Z7_UNCEI|nr:sigma-70 family RNA polymerase sigma factor [Candidatus Eisenbacteria bacterium]